MKGAKCHHTEIEFFLFNMRIANLLVCTEFQIVILSRKEVFSSLVWEINFQFMSLLKFISNVKNIGNWDQKKKIFLHIFKGYIVRVLEVFVKNHFHAIWKWCNVRQCDIYEVLFSYLVLPFCEGMLLCSFCIFSMDKLKVLVTKRNYMLLCIYDGFKDCNDM